MVSYASANQAHNYFIFCDRWNRPFTIGTWCSCQYLLSVEQKIWDSSKFHGPVRNISRYTWISLKSTRISITSFWRLTNLLLSSNTLTYSSATGKKKQLRSKYIVHIEAPTNQIVMQVTLKNWSCLPLTLYMCHIHMSLHKGEGGHVEKWQNCTLASKWSWYHYYPARFFLIYADKFYIYLVIKIDYLPLFIRFYTLLS